MFELRLCAWKHLEENRKRRSPNFGEVRQVARMAMRSRIIKVIGRLVVYSMFAWLQKHCGKKRDGAIGIALVLTTQRPSAIRCRR
jgi:hypothetical protein